jgi:hypothetical protein
VLALEREPAQDRVTKCTRAQHWQEVAEYLVDTERCLADTAGHSSVLGKGVCCMFGGKDPQGRIGTEHQRGGVVAGPRRHTCHLRSEQADTEEAVYLQLISAVIVVSMQHLTAAE